MWLLTFGDVACAVSTSAVINNALALLRMDELQVAHYIPVME
jgi:hypothetical protein